MLFNSLHFILFFPVVVITFFSLPHRFRWVLLLIASYYFYATWNPSYLILIILSTVVDYIVAIKIEKAEKRSKKQILLISLIFNLGLLFLFKYYNFFNAQVLSIFNFLDIPYTTPYSNLLLPVGISFYTFQTLSYTIDVYRGARKPIKHLGVFAVYVSFFPQLVAGPIERSTRFLPQLLKKTEFNYDRFWYGICLMFWGFFKKIVIADRIAVLVDAVYSNPGMYSSCDIIIATIFFAIQIYCDFSGYSDIAIGAAAIMGYELMINFRNPYFALSIREFWQRWHISLSTWFKDYLYIPIGGNRRGLANQSKNIMITFVISGLWHGSDWTFLAWGFVHGIFYTISLLTQNLKSVCVQKLKLESIPSIHSFLRWFFTLSIVLFAWIFFRAESFTDAFTMIRIIFSGNFSRTILSIPYRDVDFFISITGIAILLFFDFLNRNNDFFLQVQSKSILIRWSICSFLLLSSLFVGTDKEIPFIYFQF